MSTHFFFEIFHEHHNSNSCFQMINSFFYNDNKHTVTLARVATSSSSKLRTMPLEALTSTAPSFPSFRRQNPTTLSCHVSFDGESRSLWPMFLPKNLLICYMQFQDWIRGGIGRRRLRLVLKSRARASLWRKRGSCFPGLFKLPGFDFRVSLNAWFYLFFAEKLWNTCVCSKQRSFCLMRMRKICWIICILPNIKCVELLQFLWVIFFSLSNCKCAFFVWKLKLWHTFLVTSSLTYNHVVNFLLL